MLTIICLLGQKRAKMGQGRISLPALGLSLVVGLTVVLANTPGNTSSLQVGPPGIQVLLYLQGQGSALRNEESNTGAHGAPQPG